MLWDEELGFSIRFIPVYRPAEGEDLTVECRLYLAGNWKIFCKNECNKSEDILVETTADRQQNGRYSIEYERHHPAPDRMNVTIKHVSHSDSGAYVCAMETQLGSSRKDYEADAFIIKVTTGEFRILQLIYIWQFGNAITSLTECFCYNIGFINISGPGTSSFFSCNLLKSNLSSQTCRHHTFLSHDNNSAEFGLSTNLQAISFRYFYIHIFNNNRPLCN